MRKSIFIFQILFIFFASQAFSGENLIVKGKWPFGPTRSTTVDSTRNIAFIGSGGGVYVLDINNPASVVSLSEIITPGIVKGLCYKDNKLYIANNENGLMIVDVSTPESPQTIGRYEMAGQVMDVRVSGSYAFLACGDQGLVIINISQPGSPFQAAFLDTPGYASAVFVSDQAAFIADGFKGLMIINVENPASPVESGNYQTPGYAQDVYVAEGYAYIADGHQGLRIIDVSNHESVTETGFLGTTGSAYGVSVSGTTAYVASFTSGLRIINVTNPAFPTEIGYYDTSGNAYDVAVIDDLACVTDDDRGLRIIDVAVPAQADDIGAFDTAGRIESAFYYDNHTYLTDYHGGLVILNSTDLSSPEKIQFFYVPGNPSDVLVAGNNAYVAAGSRGLRILDVGTPQSPFQAGFFDFDHNAKKLTVLDNKAFIANGFGGLRIINVTDPLSPSETGVYTTADYYAEDVEVYAGYAYLIEKSYNAAKQSGMRIINIENPATPLAVGFFATDGATGLSVVGSHVFIANGTSGLKVVDVANPSLPFLAGSHDTPGNAMDVGISGNIAYVADSHGGVRAIDIQNPLSPFEAGYFDTPGNAVSVNVSGLYAFVAEQENGLVICRYMKTPVAVSATNVTWTGFTARWNEILDAQSYRLDISTKSDFSSFAYRDIYVTGNSLAVGGLLPGTNYYYRLRAFNSGDASLSSNTIPIMTAPAAPVVFTPANVTNTGFRASWSTVTGAATYRIDVSESITFSSFVPGYENLSVTGNYTQVDGLVPGHTYYIRVRAANSGGTGPNSNTANAKTISPAPLALPATNIGETGFTANWQETSGAESYRLDISDLSDFSSFLPGYNNIVINGTSRTIIGLSAGELYFYRVRAVNSGGTSDNSNTVSTRMIPRAPLVREATGVTTTSFIARWEAASGAQTYQLDASMTSEFSTFISGYQNINVTGTSYTVAGLAPGITYYYRVRAMNGAGQSPDSAYMGVITIPSPSTAVTATEIHSHDFIANWTTVNGAQYYFIDVSTNQLFSSFVSGFYNRMHDSTALVINGLDSGTIYYYRVRAGNDSGTSINSNAVTVLTLPAPPTSLYATNITTTAFTANWNPVPSALLYILDVSTAPDFSSYLPGYNNLYLSERYCRISGASSSTVYYYRIRASNNTGQGANSNTIALTTETFADANDDGLLTLYDAVITLKILAGIQEESFRQDYVAVEADINMDDRAGIEEVIYILEKISEAGEAG